MSDADLPNDGSMDPLADAAMTPMDDAAGGPTADKEQMDEPSEEEAAAQLGDFA